MEYLVSDVIRDIRVVIDENMSSAALTTLADVDTLALDDIIKSKVEDAVMIVERDAPYTLLDGGKPIEGDINWEGESGLCSGYIYLPEDFNRFVGLRMSDWDYTVTAAITDSDEQYAVQRSKFGVKGNPERPVVAIAARHNEDGNTLLALEFYTSHTDAEVVFARYLPMPSIYTEDNAKKIEICKNLYRAVIYYAAFLTALSIGDGTLATSAKATCNEILGLTTQPEVS